MGLYKSQAGVPYSLHMSAFIAGEADYYIDRLTEEWMRDRRRVDWAAEQASRTRGTEPAELLGFIALAEFHLGMDQITKGLGQTTLTNRGMGDLCDRFYRELSRSRFDEWVARAEYDVAVLAGERRDEAALEQGAASQPDDNMEAALKSLGLLSPYDAAGKITDEWRKDSDKLAWCQEHADPERMRGLLAQAVSRTLSSSDRRGDIIVLTLIALDRWFARNPLWQERWTPEDLDVDRMRTAQQMVVSDLMSERFTIWQSSAEAFVAGEPYAWESEEQGRHRSAQWYRYCNELRVKSWITPE